MQVSPVGRFPTRGRTLACSEARRDPEALCATRADLERLRRMNRLPGLFSSASGDDVSPSEWTHGLQEESGEVNSEVIARPDVFERSSLLFWRSLLSADRSPGLCFPVHRDGGSSGTFSRRLGAYPSVSFETYPQEGDPRSTIHLLEERTFLWPMMFSRSDGGPRPTPGGSFEDLKKLGFLCLPSDHVRDAVDLLALTEEFWGRSAWLVGVKVLRILWPLLDQESSLGETDSFEIAIDGRHLREDGHSLNRGNRGRLEEEAFEDLTRDHEFVSEVKMVLGREPGQGRFCLDRQLNTRAIVSCGRRAKFQLLLNEDELAGGFAVTTGVARLQFAIGRPRLAFRPPRGSVSRCLVSIEETLRGEVRSYLPSPEQTWHKGCQAE